MILEFCTETGTAADCSTGKYSHGAQSRPPVTGIARPLMKDAPSDARNMTACATSCSSPARPAGQNWIQKNPPVYTLLGSQIPVVGPYPRIAQQKLEYFRACIIPARLGAEL